MSTPMQELDIVDILIEFLEVSIHHLLFLRNLYPPSIFVPRKIYNIPVQVSRHPAINEYIAESLRSVRFLLQQGCVKSIAVCFYNDDQAPIERFVFDILDLEKQFRLSSGCSDSCLLQLRDGFRAFSLKMAATDMEKLNEHCTFQIHVNTSEQGSHALANDPVFEDFPWIELEEREKELASPSINPLRTIHSEF